MIHYDLSDIDLAMAMKGDIWIVILNNNSNGGHDNNWSIRLWYHRFEQVNVTYLDTFH